MKRKTRTLTAEQIARRNANLCQPKDKHIWGKWLFKIDVMLTLAHLEEFHQYLDQIKNSGKEAQRWLSERGYKIAYSTLLKYVRRYRNEVGRLRAAARRAARYMNTALEERSEDFAGASLVLIDKAVLKHLIMATTSLEDSSGKTAVDDEAEDAIDGVPRLTPYELTELVKIVGISTAARLRYLAIKRVLEKFRELIKQKHMTRNELINHVRDIMGLPPMRPDEEESANAAIPYSPANSGQLPEKPVDAGKAKEN